MTGPATSMTIAPAAIANVIAIERSAKTSAVQTSCATTIVFMYVSAD